MATLTMPSSPDESCCSPGPVLQLKGGDAKNSNSNSDYGSDSDHGGAPASTAAAAAAPRRPAFTSGPLRSGHWTPEELLYVGALIEDFQKGYLSTGSIEGGATLRNYLAEQVHCTPKRISKKFESSGYYGRQTYREATAIEKPLSAETQKIIRDRTEQLQDLKDKFEDSVEKFERTHAVNQEAKKAQKAIKTIKAAAKRKKKMQEEDSRMNLIPGAGGRHHDTAGTLASLLNSHGVRSLGLGGIAPPLGVFNNLGGAAAAAGIDTSNMSEEVLLNLSRRSFMAPNSTSVFQQQPLHSWSPAASMMQQQQQQSLQHQQSSSNNGNSNDNALFMVQARLRAIEAAKQQLQQQQAMESNSNSAMEAARQQHQQQQAQQQQALDANSMELNMLRETLATKLATASSNGAPSVFNTEGARSFARQLQQQDDQNAAANHHRRNNSTSVAYNNGNGAAAAAGLMQQQQQQQQQDCAHGLSGIMPAGATVGSLAGALSTQASYKYGTITQDALQLAQQFQQGRSNGGGGLDGMSTFGPGSTDEQTLARLMQQHAPCGNDAPGAKRARYT